MTHLEQEIVPAVAFAKIFKAQLDLFHVSLHQPDGAKLAEDLRKSTGYDKISFTEVIPAVEGDVNQGLHHYVEQHKPDVLVMFYTRRNWFDKLLLSSRTKNVVFHAETAVLSIKREARMSFEFWF